MEPNNSELEPNKTTSVSDRSKVRKEYFHWLHDFLESEAFSTNIEETRQQKYISYFQEIIINTPAAVESSKGELGKILVPNCPACRKPGIVLLNKCFSCGFIIEKPLPRDCLVELNTEEAIINPPFQEKEHKIIPEEKRLSVQSDERKETTSVKNIAIESETEKKSIKMFVTAILFGAILIIFAILEINSNKVPQALNIPMNKSTSIEKSEQDQTKIDLEKPLSKKPRNETYYITNKGGTNLRDKPGIKSKIIILLPYRTSLKILDEGQSLTELDHKYYQVQTINSKIGWVYAGDKDDWLSTTEPQPVAPKEIGKSYAVLSPNGVNLRSDPSNNSQKIGKLEAGDIVIILDKQNSLTDSNYLYYKVRAIDGSEGWAYAGDNDEWFVPLERKASSSPAEIKQKIKIPCWVICLVATPEKGEAEKEAEKFRRQGYPTGVLWIPDYLSISLSGNQMWLAYAGPVSYDNRTEAESLLKKIKPLVSSAYAVKIDQSGKNEAFW